MPARAPPSIDMLQMVIRCSIDSARMAGPLYSNTCPVPPPTPILASRARITSLAVTPAARRPSTRTSKVLGRRWSRVWVASTCSTSLVPMPKARAPKAPWVEVWESPQTIVMPGWVSAQLGPDDVHDALVGAVHAVQGDAVGGAVALQPLHLGPGQLVDDRQGPVRGRHRVVGGGQGQVGPADLEAAGGQPGERLGRGHLVDEVEVDVQHGRQAGKLRHHVAVPDLVESRVRGAGMGWHLGSVRAASHPVGGTSSSAAHGNRGGAGRGPAPLPPDPRLSGAGPGSGAPPGARRPTSLMAPCPASPPPPSPSRRPGAPQARDPRPDRPGRDGRGHPRLHRRGDRDRARLQPGQGLQGHRVVLGPVTAARTKVRLMFRVTNTGNRRPPRQVRGRPLQHQRRAGRGRRSASRSRSARHHPQRARHRHRRRATDQRHRQLPRPRARLIPGRAVQERTLRTGGRVATLAVQRRPAPPASRVRRPTAVATRGSASRRGVAAGSSRQPPASVRRRPSSS